MSMIRAVATAHARTTGLDVARNPLAQARGQAAGAAWPDDLPRLTAQDCRKSDRIRGLVTDLNAAQGLARLTRPLMPLTAAARFHLLTVAGLGGKDPTALMDSFKGPGKEVQT